MKNKSGGWRWLVAGIRKYFLSGLMVIVPVVATILVLTFIFVKIDGILQPFLGDVIRRFYPGFTGEVTGLGFVLTILLVFITGMIASNYIGRKVIKLGESWLARVPIFRQVYLAVKQVSVQVSGTGVNIAAFRRVVFVQFPFEGMTSIAFVTNELTDPRGTKLYSLYVPTPPNPASGYFIIARADLVIPSDLAVDKAFMTCISGGIIASPVMDITGSGRKPPSFSIP